MKHRLALCALTTILAAPGLAVAAPAAQAAEGCQIVSTATSETPGASYRQGDQWFTLYRTQTATTELCDGAYSTTIEQGPWIPRAGSGGDGNVAFAREKALYQELDRLRAVIDRLRDRVTHLRLKIKAF